MNSIRFLAMNTEMNARNIKMDIIESLNKLKDSLFLLVRYFPRKKMNRIIGSNMAVAFSYMASPITTPMRMALFFVLKSSNRYVNSMEKKAIGISVYEISMKCVK